MKIEDAPKAKELAQRIEKIDAQLNLIGFSITIEDGELEALVNAVRDRLKAERAELIKQLEEL